MTQYARILFAADLVPEDDCPVSEKALDLARSTGAELHIMHVIEQYAFSYGNDAPFVPNAVIWKEEIHKAAFEKLTALGVKLGVSRQRVYLLHGQASRAILEKATEMEADLIVMGSHARHGLGLLLLGSTASAVLHHATCDVLAVRVGKTAVQKEAVPVAVGATA